MLPLSISDQKKDESQGTRQTDTKNAKDAISTS